MSTTTQQILCCVGTSVASRPTQFIMERAFATLGHDWRAVTVEVAPENFDIALKGMAAMGFRALRIYPSLGAEAARLLCSADCKSSFVGHATSAELADCTWQCWDHSGYGLLAALNSRLDWRHAALVVDGDGLMQRSLLAAISETGRWPRKIIWSSPPGELPAWLTSVGGSTSQGSTSHSVLGVADPHERSFHAVNVADEQGQILHPIDEQAAARLFGLTPENGTDPELKWIVYLSKAIDLLTTLPLDELRQRGLEQVLMHIANGELQTQALPINNDLPVPLISIDMVEVLIECEAYDFRRWTGQSIDRGLIQEAYDEFNDF